MPCKKIFCSALPLNFFQVRLRLRAVHRGLLLVRIRNPEHRTQRAPHPLEADVGPAARLPVGGGGGRGGGVGAGHAPGRGQAALLQPVPGDAGPVGARAPGAVRLPDGQVRAHPGAARQGGGRRRGGRKAASRLNQEKTTRCFSYNEWVREEEASLPHRSLFFHRSLSKYNDENISFQRVCRSSFSQFFVLRSHLPICPPYQSLNVAGPYDCFFFPGPAPFDRAFLVAGGALRPMEAASSAPMSTKNLGRQVQSGVKK